jgi:hypothetical protein
MANFFISINGPVFEKEKKDANTKAMETYGPGSEREYLWDKLEVIEPTIEFKDGELEIFGDTKLGYFSVTINMDLETITKITEYYIKKLNRLKTVLEATK